MPLPAIAATAGRAVATARRGARAMGRTAKRRAALAGTRKSPHVLDIEGIMMLALAFIFDVVNIILGVLDFVLVGLVLSPIWNSFALGTLGIWLWVRTGQGA